MARPERKTVDYFPHYISDGKKMFFIEHKYGNDGYAVWFKILEMLASTEDHYLNLSNDTDLMFLSAKCRVSEVVLCNILDDLSKLGEVDKNMWSNKIVWSQKFIDSVQDAYARRNNKCMDFDSLCSHLLSLRILKSDFRPKKKDRNTQSIVKDTKENKSKLMLWLEESCPTVMRMKKPITQDEADRIVVDFPNMQDVEDLFISMENKKSIATDYSSSNLTFRQWAKNRIDRNPMWGKVASESKSNNWSTIITAHLGSSERSRQIVQAFKDTPQDQIPHEFREVFNVYSQIL